MRAEKPPVRITLSWEPALVYGTLSERPTIATHYLSIFTMHWSIFWARKTMQYERYRVILFVLITSFRAKPAILSLVFPRNDNIASKASRESRVKVLLKILSLGNTDLRIFQLIIPPRRKLKRPTNHIISSHDQHELLPNWRLSSSGPLQDHEHKLPHLWNPLLAEANQSCSWENRLSVRMSGGCRWERDSLRGGGVGINFRYIVL